MLNPFSIAAVVLALAAVLGDLFLNDAQILLFLGRKALDLIDWVEFWR